MSISQLHTKAKAFDLSQEELQFIIHYAQKVGIDPERVLVNKELFENLVAEYERESLRPDQRFVEILRQKLGFASPLGATFQSTRGSLPPGTMAKFIFADGSFAPIKLEKNKPDYLLWEVISHRNMDRLKKGEEGHILIEDRYGRSYRFPSRILDELRQNVTLIRTPHAEELELLKDRSHPRIAVEGVGWLQRLVEGRREGERYPARLKSLSNSGITVVVENGGNLFGRYERLWIEFEVGGQQVRGVVKVVLGGSDGKYLLLFENFDPRSMRVIERFIASKI
ncbi:MAG: hypothetical protein C6I00_05940 [Nitratiruptor sp.]|nr:hypothetical protein [Nitratiruptor sp.]NPA83642.1 PilZ domain-containing protein [Campylobacterota bacterium]